MKDLVEASVAVCAETDLTVNWAGQLKGAQDAGCCRLKKTKGQNCIQWFRRTRQIACVHIFRLRRRPLDKSDKQLYRAILDTGYSSQSRIADTPDKVQNISRH